jgi:hypothetical protein
VSKLLQWFSLAKRGGIEIFSFAPPSSSHVLDESLSDPQLLSGFLEAIQMLSETLGSPIRQIHFSNMMLYVRTYGDFSLRLLLEEKLEENEIEALFQQLANETGESTTESGIGIVLRDEDAYRDKITRVLLPFIQDPLAGDLSLLGVPEAVSKIALAGLANAGKTSIKNMFFENWPKEMVKGITGTVGISTMERFLNFLRHRLVIFDFGGQTTFRAHHLTNEKAWGQISSLIYVVDVQDQDSFETSRQYLRDIWDLVTRVNQTEPRLSIFLHKFDGDVRKELEGNVSRCLAVFREFLEFASFHLTTIEDSASTVAMIKSLYFSLPDVVLRRLLEEEFLQYFEEEILARFSEMVKEKDFVEVFEKIKHDIRASAIIAGRKCGYSLQKSWLESLMGQRAPKQRLLSSKTIRLVQKGRSLFITITDWTDQGYPKRFTDTLFEATLDGVLRTLHLGPPLIVQDSGSSTTWKIDL